MQFVPAAIGQRAEKYRLGRLQSVYVFRKQLPLGYFLGPLSILIGCLIFVFFALRYEDGFSWLPQLPGLAALADWQVGLVLLVGVAWLLVGVWMVVAARIVRWMRVFVYEDGLISLRTQAVVVPWRQVVGLWKDVRVVGRSGKKGTRRAYILQCMDDTLVRFDDEIVDIEKLGSLLEDTITRRLLPEAIATYEAGGSVVFAELAISTRGIRVKRTRQTRQVLLWQDVAGVTIDDMTVALYHFHKNGTWATLPVAAIPNVGVLKALLEYAMRDLSHARLPGVLATYETGLALDFGALHVSLRGVDVQQGSVFLPWHEIASIAVGEQEVIIRRLGLQSSWYTIPISMVYDAGLLKELLGYLMGNP